MDTSLVGRYRIETSLGIGGMGEVYKAFDERLGRAVAVKTLPHHRQLNPEQRRQLEREARNLATVNHSAVAQIYDIITVAGSDYLVLEFVEGENLADLLRSRPYPLTDALRLAQEVAEGLAAAHAKGIIHRDLKAENVIVTPSGHAKILDLGLAKLASAKEQEGDAEIRARGGIVGTLSAMSPEQVLNNEVDERSDLFALGILLYLLLTGKHPFFTAMPIETARRIVHENPQPTHELSEQVPVAVSRLVSRLLAKSPDQRPATAAEVAQALRAQVEQLSGPTLMPETESAWHRRGMVVLAVVVVVAGIVTWLLGARSDPTISVAVTRPQLETGESPGQIGAASIAIRVAAVNLLATLEGVYTLNFAEVDAVTGDVRQVAMATAADEVLTTTLLPSKDSWVVTLCRASGKDLRITWADTFEVPLQNTTLLSDTVAAHLRVGYSERRPKEGAFNQTASTDDLNTFIMLNEQVQDPPSDISWTWMLEQLTALRRSSPGLLAAYGIEATIARYLYESTRNEMYIEHAKDVISAAREMAPLDQRPLHGEVEVALALNDLEWAQQAISELERLDPNYPSLVSFKARLAEQRGDAEAALRLFREALEARPSWRRMLELGNVERRHGLAEEARQHLQRALEMVPNNLAALADMAAFELMLGSLEEAEQLYLRLVFLSPQPHYLNELGTTQLLLGRYEEAAATYQRVLDKGSRLPVQLLNLADCYSFLGRQEQANELYREVIEVIDAAETAPSPVDLGFRGQCLSHLGQQQRALENVQEALAQAPSSPDVAYSAAVIAAVSGDLESAQYHADRAITLGMSLHWFNIPWFEKLRRGTSFRNLGQPEAGATATAGT